MVSESLASSENSAAATGIVPYAAANDNELADARWSDGTRCGTEASFAGVHSNVNTSSTRDATMRPGTVSTKGSDANTAARPMSQATMSFLRSKRSARTPAAGPRKNPGTMRADITRPTAASGRSLMRVARAAMARKPSQSPVAETT